MAAEETDHPRNGPTYEQMLRDAFQAWDAVRNKAPVESFLADQLMTRHVCSHEQEARETARTISRTIDRVSELYRELRQSTVDGATREQWLQRHLGGSADRPVGGGAQTAAAIVQQVLDAANRNLITRLSVETPQSLPIRTAPQLPQGAHQLEAALKVNTNLAAIATSAFLPGSAQGTIAAVADCFNSDLDSTAERELKKVAAVTTVVAAATEAVQIPEGIGPAAIVLMVDRGVTAAKVAAKVGSGQMPVVEATEYLIDRAAAIASATVESYAGNVGGAIGETVGAALGSIFGPVGTAIGAQVGQVAGTVIGEIAGRGISTGIKYVAEKAKTAVRNVFSGALSGTRNLAARLFG